MKFDGKPRAPLKRLTFVPLLFGVVWITTWAVAEEVTSDNIPRLKQWTDNSGIVYTQYAGKQGNAITQWTDKNGLVYDQWIDTDGAMYTQWEDRMGNVHTQWVDHDGILRSEVVDRTQVLGGVDRTEWLGADRTINQPELKETKRKRAHKGHKRRKTKKGKDDESNPVSEDDAEDQDEDQGEDQGEDEDTTGTDSPLVGLSDKTGMNPPGRLVSSIMISRHGDRTPQLTAPAFAAGNRRSYLTRFPIDYSPWEVDYGQLSHIGFRQSYMLGSWLRQRYILGAPINRLLDDRYDHVQTHARSTDVDRTLVTAMGILAGLYPTGTGPEEGIPGRTELIPVHTVAYSMDALLDGSATAHCPKFDEASQEALDTDYVSHYVRANTALMDALPELSGVNADDINNMETKSLMKLLTSLRDLRVCQRAHDVAQPHNVTKFDPILEDITNRVIIAKWQNTDMGNLVGGRLLRAVGHRFDMVRALEMGDDAMVERLHMECNEKGNDSDEDGGCPRKFVLYVGHDTTIFDMRAALGIPITVIPGVVPYVSHIVFELRKTDDDKFYVQVMTGDFARAAEPVAGPFCENRFYCGLEIFEQYVEHMVPKNVDAMCGVVRDGTGEYRSSFGNKAHGPGALKVTTVLLSVAGVFTLGLLAYRLIRGRGASRAEYQDI